MRVGVEPVAEGAETVQPVDSAKTRDPVCLSDLRETGRET
jgi:hypothetical protein